MLLDSARVCLWLVPPLLFSYGLHLGSVVAAATAGDGNKFLYSGFSGANNLTLDGTATITPSGHLQLTNGTVQRKGHAFHPTPLRLRRPLPLDDLSCKKKSNATSAAAIRSFSASFVFGIVPAAAGMGGHGIALVVAPSKDLSSGIASTYMGFLNRTSDGKASNHIFAVELDTIQNPDFHDVDNNHVGIDVNSLESVKSATAGYYVNDGGFRPLTLVSGEAMQAWVDYDGGAARVDVTLAPAGTKKLGRPLVSATVDLSAVITDESYVGFSSSTGTLSTRHYVLGWSFSVDDGPAPDIDVSNLPELPRSSKSSSSKHQPSRTLAIALPIVAGMLIFSIVATCVLLVMRRWYRYVDLREDWEVEFGAHRLSHRDLFRATGGFSDKNLLGAGGFGRVYRGVLPTSGTEVAVKRVSHESRQGVKEFVAEVASIGRLRHRNLVQLLGYCRLKDELLLVYDYMPNGSLDRLLYNNSSSNKAAAAPSWAQRFQIIRDVASALLYLHEEWEQVVIHRDVKASNVLLDAGMNARLGDFGLARLRGHDDAAEMQTTAAVTGTFGYIAPELALTGRASPLTDVFAFGAFLLEVVTGRRPVEQQAAADDGKSSSGRVMLIDWVFEHWRRETLIEVVDPRIIQQGDDDYNVDELSLALRVGLLCSQPVADARPSMRQVVQYLQGGDTASLPDLRPPAQHVGLSVLALLHNQGFDSYVMATSSSSLSSMKRLGG